MGYVNYNTGYENKGTNRELGFVAFQNALDKMVTPSLLSLFRKKKNFFTSRMPHIIAADNEKLYIIIQLIINTE